MAQSYKIFFNASVLWLCDQKGRAEIGEIPKSKNTLESPFLNGKTQLFNFIDWLEKSQFQRTAVIVGPSADDLFALFCSIYKIVEAAGGYVLNEKGELLLIHRRGSWDLPKGKIEKGESTELAALREVEEETGLKNLTLGEPLLVTYHTHEQKKQRILKPSHWFKMTADSAETLVAQAEEDIEEVKWQEPRAFLDESPVVFGSIRDVILAGINQK